MSDILIIAPHADDETLGCGGTILRHKSEGETISWLLVTSMLEKDGFSKSEIQIRNNEINLVAEAYGFDETIKLDYSPTKIDMIPMKNIVESISKTIQKIQPSVLYFPFHNDIHSDHRIISEAVLSCSKSFRYEYIKKFRAYEVLSETEFASDLYSDSFNPNLWIDISDFIDKKIEIMEIYKSEIKEPPFPRSEENIRALATYRGSTVGSISAESFIQIKEII